MPHFAFPAASLRSQPTNDPSPVNPTPPAHTSAFVETPLNGEQKNPPRPSPHLESSSPSVDRQSGTNFLEYIAAAKFASQQNAVGGERRHMTTPASPFSSPSGTPIDSLDHDIKNAPKRLVYVTGFGTYAMLPPLRIFILISGQESCEDLGKLRDHFSRVGEIDSLCEYVQKGGPSHYAILYRSPGDAARAVESFDMSQYAGARTLSVRTGGRSLFVSPAPGNLRASALREISDRTGIVWVSPTALGFLVEFATEWDAARAAAVLSSQYTVTYHPALQPISASDRGPSNATVEELDPATSDEISRLVAHVEAGLTGLANQLRARLQERGTQIPWHPSFERCIADTSSVNLPHIAGWFAILPPATPELERGVARCALDSPPHNMSEIKEIGLLAASKGYLDVGLRAVRLVVSQEPSEISARYVADWEDAATRSKDLFLVPILQVLSALYRRGVVEGLSLAGRVADADATLADLTFSDIRVRIPEGLVSYSNQSLDSTVPPKIPFLQKSLDLVKSVMPSASLPDATFDLRALSSLERMAVGLLPIWRRSHLELARFMRQSGALGIPHLDALCVQIEHRGDALTTSFWLAGAMQYLMDGRQYAAAVYLYSQYCLADALQTEIQQVAQAFPPVSSAPEPEPGRQIVPTVAHDRILLKCLIRLCPTVAEARHCSSTRSALRCSTRTWRPAGAVMCSCSSRRFARRGGPTSSRPCCPPSPRSRTAKASWSSCCSPMRPPPTRPKSSCSSRRCGSRCTACTRHATPHSSSSKASDASPAWRPSGRTRTLCFRPLSADGRR
ncbi:hypothetical protein FB451DRAFT_62740 [Mycena latifolia]|nr:hypothetical protein FB451DRAFT_62740 [Mycena latifolia]